MQCTYAKSNPTPLTERQIAFNRAQSLNNGISISWFEQTWNKNVLSKNPLTTTDFKFLKNLVSKAFASLLRLSTLRKQVSRLRKYLHILMKF
jgi:endoglucanase